ncbi:peptidoglycan editing factor PgeF [Bacillus alkalicellulosilyticus]|uniref:peptidoglycan editing factor PgeF n=1 Tax=Alkalihalobacterium alkalicellulosilyticum TaxID=1912214 RepID=UPI001FE904A9|nr:peptidoglycan editing factor PgeF [Bacillus alkalicellulosilyticus]
MNDSPLFIQTDNDILQLNHERLPNDMKAGFSIRTGGVSSAPYQSLNMGFHVGDVDEDVRLNRKILAEKIGFPLDCWVVGEQIHQANIYKVASNDKGKGAFSLHDSLKGIDGLYTSERNILLVSLYADCVPLYFFAPNYDLIGVAHAGWKGTVLNIGATLIEQWKSIEKVPITEIQCVIGPSIGKKEYEVDERVIQEVEKVLPNTDTFATPLENGHYLLDLKEVNKLLLENEGIPIQNISVTHHCTASQLDLFFSHRKEKGQTGRMMSYIGMKGE